MRYLLFFLPLLCAAQTAQYPASVVTDNQLMVARNQTTTTLQSAVGVADTTVVVKSTAGFLANMLITIDSEVMQVCSVAGTNTLNIGHSSCPNADGRGWDGSTAATHAVNKGVGAFIDSWHHNAMAAEVKAIEQNARQSPWVDLRPYGAVCNGTNIASAVTAAITAGKTRLFIPDGCVYTPPGNDLPRGIQFGCENDQAPSIVTATPATDHLFFQPGASITHCGVRSAFCQGSAHPQNVPKTCTVQYATNQGDSNKIVTFWIGNVFVTDYGPTWQVEPSKTITNVTNNGSGLIRVTTSTAHGYNTDESVAVVGVGGVPNANRVTPGNGFIYPWAVTVVNATTFDLQGSSFAGAYTSGGTSYRNSSDMNAFTIIDRNMGGAFYTELSNDGIGSDILISGTDRMPGDTNAARAAHVRIAAGTGPVIGQHYEIATTDPGFTGVAMYSGGCTGNWLNFSDLTNGTGLKAGCNGAVALSSNTTGSLFPELSLASRRGFVSETDGIVIPFLASNGTAGTHDFGSIAVGSNPATADGGSGQFKLCVGGNSSGADAASCFLSATATSAGTLDLATLGSTNTGTLKSQAVSQQLYTINNITKMGITPAGVIAQSVNYIATETGAANAIAGALPPALALADGMCVSIQLAHTLAAAGANTFNLNGGGAVAIKSHFNTANNIATGYAATGRTTLCYNSTLPAWVDMAQ